MAATLGVFSADCLAAAKKKKPAHVVAGIGEDAAPVWATSRSLKPPVKLRNFSVAEFNYGKRKCGYAGLTRIWDPVNRQLLWIGGNCLSMDKGFAGNWQTADGKTWVARELRARASLLSRARHLGEVYPVGTGLCCSGE